MIALGISLPAGTRHLRLPDSDIIAALDAWAARVAHAGDGVVRWPATFAVWCDVSDPESEPAPRGWLPLSDGLASALLARGIVPVVHLETSRWSCKEIAAGVWDSRLAWWADTANRRIGQVIVRLDQEPNGSMGSWTEKRGTDPADYRSMWRHVVPLMRAVAPNLRFVWCVIARGPGQVAEFDRWWPGPECVDVCGLDVYDAEGDGMPALADKALPSLRKLVTYGKPTAIMEAGSARQKGNDAARGDWWDSLRRLVTLDVQVGDPILASYFDLDMRALPGSIETANWTLTGALLKRHAAMMADTTTFSVASPPRLVE